MRPPTPARDAPLHDPLDPRHGTTGGYNNHGCRCDRCRDAVSAASRALKATRKQLRKDPNDPRHGTVTFYDAWGCRCELCTAAASAKAKRQRDKGRKFVIQPGPHVVAPLR